MKDIALWKALMEFLFEAELMSNLDARLTPPHIPVVHCLFDEVSRTSNLLDGICRARRYVSNVAGKVVDATEEKCHDSQAVVLQKQIKPRSHKGHRDLGLSFPVPSSCRQGFA
jgi:hypothetical protein